MWTHDIKIQSFPSRWKPKIRNNRCLITCDNPQRIMGLAPSSVGFSGTPNNGTPLGFPYYSNILRDSYGSGMGIVWEAYHNWVDLSMCAFLSPPTFEHCQSSLSNNALSGCSFSNRHCQTMPFQGVLSPIIIVKQ